MANSEVALSSLEADVEVVGRGVNVLAEADGEGPFVVSTSDSRQ